MSRTVDVRTRAHADAIDAQAPAREDGRDTDWGRALSAVLADPGQPKLVAQPIVDLDRSGIDGFELLSRFPAPPDATPDVWFAQAERIGAAPALTAKVITEALMLRDRLPKDTYLTFNVSPRLLSDPAVGYALHSAGALDRVVVELTEQVAVSDQQALRVAVERLRRAGGRIAVDDSGTGYAGLKHLMGVPPDIVKVDRKLINGLDTDPVKRASIEVLRDMVTRIDADLIAEGVQTPAELTTLAALGVRKVQGWLLARPGPPWAVLDPAVTQLLASCAGPARRTDQVRSLVRECITMDRSIWCVSNALPPGVGRPMVVVDSDGKAIGVVTRDNRGTAYLAPVMAVTPTSTPAAATRRAMARAVCHRGIPLVCTDEDGKVLGVVDVADLVSAAIGDR